MAPRKGAGGRRKTARTADSKVGEFRSGPQKQTGLILGQRFGIKSVQYSLIEGICMFEGDIVLGTEKDMATQTQALQAAQRGEVEMAVVISGAQFRWPNCRIPFDIDPTLPNQNRVTDAISHWEANTRFRFVLRTAANAATFPDWVTYRPSTGCSSSVGRQGGQQFVNLGPGCTTGNAIHETGHVVGLWHEQSREDRDSFVAIHWDKIQPGLEHNFDQHITDGDDVGAYDYGSIMHYPRDAFSIDGTDTITPTNPATAAIGQRVALSAGDIAAANSFCPLKLIKEGRKEVILDTVKEATKDLRTDTRKELVLDTRKELISDTAKESALDTRKESVFDTIKEGISDPIGGKQLSDPIRPGGGTIGPITGPLARPGGAAPFAVATAHQAPGAGNDRQGLAQNAAELDAQLQALAEALVQTEASLQSLQQQYDETAALLKQVMDADERQSDV